MPKIRTTITIDEELYKDIEDMSNGEERSISQQITYLVRKGMEITESQKDAV
jgi:predicted CopG family antitoxin